MICMPSFSLLANMMMAPDNVIIIESLYDLFHLVASFSSKQSLKNISYPRNRDKEWVGREGWRWTKGTGQEGGLL